MNTSNVVEKCQFLSATSLELFFKIFLIKFRNLKILWDDPQNIHEPNSDDL